MADNGQNNKYRQERSAGKAPFGAAWKKNRPLCIALLVAAALAMVYLLCCVLAAGRTTVFPHVRVEGVSLGGLTCPAAEEKLRENAEALSGERTIPILLDGVQVSEVTTTALSAIFDPALTAESAYRVGREGGFFANGWTYLRCVLGGGGRAPCFDLTPEAMLACAQEVAARHDRAPVDGTYRISGGALYLRRERAGEVIDVNALQKSLRTALHEGDFSGFECAATSRQGLALDLEQVHQSLQNGANATFDRASGTVREARVGAEFDVEEASRLLMDAEPGQEVCVPATVFEPTIFKAELEAVLFRDVLGAYTTYVGGLAARIENVRRAAEEINDYVLNAGETFSFNAALGEVTAENGYAPAALNAGDGTLSAMGGGVSQCASTLYYACVLSDLTVVRRAGQTYAPNYITLGCDAAAGDGVNDFVFRNDTDYPVRIVAQLAGNELRVQIFGTNPSGRTVRLISHTVSSTLYETVYQETDSLPFGQMREISAPYIGYTVRTYRNVYDAGGTLTSSALEAETDYAVRNREVLTGTTMPQEPAGEGTNPAEGAAP